MKKLIFFLLVGSLFSFLSSCDFLNNNHDGYNRDNAWVSFGLIQKDTASQTFTIALDDGSILNTDPNSGWYSRVKNNQRVLANYTIIGDKKDTLNTVQYNVEINSLRNILYKSILTLTPTTPDSTGTDPIHVRDHWLKNNMLNFELSYFGGSKIHLINLVRQPTATATEPVVLELRHNANRDPEMIRLSAVVTFDLSSLKVAGKDSVSFRVIAKDFNGDDFGYTGVYKY